MDIKVPNLSESVTEGDLGAWLVEDGARVEKDQLILELETDKATVELAAEASGILRILVEAGETVRVGDVIGRIEEEGEAEAEAGEPAEAEPEAGEEPEAEEEEAEEEPEAEEEKEAEEERKAEEEPEAEEEKEAEERKEAEEAEKPREPEKPEKPERPEKPEEPEEPEKPEEPRRVGKPEPQPEPGREVRREESVAHERVIRETVRQAAPAERRAAEPAEPAAEPGVRRERMTRLRRRIAERLVEAQRTAAILTTFNEIDMGPAIGLREEHRADFEERHGVRLGFMSLFARASILALREFPELNAFVEGEEIVYHDHVHLGIAVGTPRGLVVPVLKHADRMTFADIERAIRELAVKAREGDIAIEDLQDGTFTITNGGIYGSLMSTPILNPPQSGILGMHKIEQRPVTIEDDAGERIESRPMMYVALSYDHRIVDGEQAVTFLVRVKERLEDPTRLLLDS